MVNLATVIVTTPDGKRVKEVVEYSDMNNHRELINKTLLSNKSAYYLCNSCNHLHRKPVCGENICKECNSYPCIETCSCNECQAKRDSDECGNYSSWVLFACIEY